MHIFITSCQQVCDNYDSEYCFHLFKYYVIKIPFGTNVCFKKNWTKFSSDTLLQFVQVFLKQTLDILKVYSEFSSLFWIKLYQSMLQMLCRILRESNENSDVIKNFKFLELHENHEEIFFTASLFFLNQWAVTELDSC